LVNIKINLHKLFLQIKIYRFQVVQPQTVFLIFKCVHRQLLLEKCCIRQSRNNMMFGIKPSLMLCSTKERVTAYTAR